MFFFCAAFIFEYMQYFKGIFGDNRSFPFGTNDKFWELWPRNKNIAFKDLPKLLFISGFLKKKKNCSSYLWKLIRFDCLYFWWGATGWISTIMWAHGCWFKISAGNWGERRNGRVRVYWNHVHNKLRKYYGKSCFYKLFVAGVHLKSDRKE